MSRNPNPEGLAQLETEAHASQEPRRVGMEPLENGGAKSDVVFNLSVLCIPFSPNLHKAYAYTLCYGESLNCPHPSNKVMQLGGHTVEEPKCQPKKFQDPIIGAVCVCGRRSL